MLTFMLEGQLLASDTPAFGLYSLNNITKCQVITHANADFFTKLEKAVLPSAFKLPTVPVAGSYVVIDFNTPANRQERHAWPHWTRDRTCDEVGLLRSFGP